MLVEGNKDILKNRTIYNIYSPILKMIYRFIPKILENHWLILIYYHRVYFKIVFYKIFSYAGASL